MPPKTRIAPCAGGFPLFGKPHSGEQLRYLQWLRRGAHFYNVQDPAAPDDPTEPDTLTAGERAALLDEEEQRRLHISNIYRLLNGLYCAEYYTVPKRANKLRHRLEVTARVLLIADREAQSRRAGDIRRLYNAAKICIEAGDCPAAKSILDKIAAIFPVVSAAITFDDMDDDGNNGEVFRHFHREIAGPLE
ncbi:MAG: hypothetical protein PHI85_04230 [Victivallaceae bacterium]|nr:hypothetical protein [Victivallaceae bacterium]